MSQEFKIVKKEAFRVLGIKICTTNKKKEGTKAIPQHWKEFHQQGIQEQLMPMMNQDPYGVFGISVYNIEEDAYKFEHYIAVSSTKTETERFTSYVVPAATWAVFPCTIETIGKTEVQAIMKWIPKAGYKPMNKGYITGKMKALAPDIEYYGEDGKVEVWVAIKEK